MQQTITVNYSIDRVFNFLKNGNNYISKSIENVKLNKAGTAANASIPVLGIIRIDLKADEKNNTVCVYSNQIGTTITAELKSVGEGEKTEVKFTIDCNPKLDFIKNLAIKSQMNKVMNIMVSEIRKAVM